MASLLDDFRLAPILDDAALFGTTYDDLFSLDLPPLQDTSPPKPTVPEGTHGDLLIPTRPYYPELQDGIATPSTRQPPRSLAPLAGVLNDEGSHEISTTMSKSMTLEDASRKRRRFNHDVDWSGSLQLPQPLSTKAQEPQMPAIPPLLQGLHEPPPTAGLFPMITDKPSPTWPRQPSGSQESTVAEQSYSFHRRPDQPWFRDTEALPIQQSRPAPRTEQPQQCQLSDVGLGGTKSADHKSMQTPKPTTSRRSKAALERQKWTIRESTDLKAGVARHGVGRWRKILADPTLRFDHRTAVDLKDHYRVCLLRDRKDKAPTTTTKMSPGAQPDRISVNIKKPANPGQHSITGDSHESRRTGAVQVRRPRTVFTEVEDRALLKGFERHGSTWAKIRDDRELCLQHRAARDLRDRVRHKWPEKYEQIGLRGNQREVSTRKGSYEGGSQDVVHSSSLNHVPRYVDPVVMWKPTVGFK